MHCFFFSFKFSHKSIKIKILRTKTKFFSLKFKIMAFLCLNLVISVELSLDSRLRDDSVFGISAYAVNVARQFDVRDKDQSV